MLEREIGGFFNSLLGTAGQAGLNGDLARLIQKGKLSDEERKQFEATANQLRLPRFYRWGAKNLLELQPLDETILNQIRRRLAEKRVAQHIPADMSGLKVEENTRGVERVEKGRVYLRQFKRDDKGGKLKVNPTDEVVGKTIGLQPSNGIGKLQSIRGVRVISDNFGVAVLDHATDLEDRFAIIPWHKVWHRIQALKEKNKGEFPRILRNGTLINVANPKNKAYQGVWMIRGAQLNQRDGHLVDISRPDVIDCRELGKPNVRLQSLYEGGLQILDNPLTGISACPTTSSA